MLAAHEAVPQRRGAAGAQIESLVASILEKPHAAIAMGKALLYRRIETGIEAAYADAGETMACNFVDASGQEGVAAFLQKREPRWAAG